MFENNFQEEEKESSGKGPIVWLLSALLLALIAACGYLLINSGGESELASESKAVTKNTTDGNSAEAAAETVPVEASTDELGMRLVMDDYKLTVSGTLPDEDSVKAYNDNVALFFAGGLNDLVFKDRLDVDVKFNDELEPAPWVQLAPRLNGLIRLLVNGDITLTSDTMTLNGTIDSPQAKALLLGQIEQMQVFPEVTDNLTVIANPVYPKTSVKIKNGIADVSIEASSESTLQTVQTTVGALYGPNNQMGITDLNIVTEVNPAINAGTIGYLQSPLGSAPWIPFGDFEYNVGDGGLTVALGEDQLLKFASGSDQVPPAFQEALGQVSRLLLGNVYQMKITGHTDSDGDDALNQSLSERRAQSVKNIIVGAANQATQNNFNADRVTVVGFGESKPIAANDTPENKAKNRRVQIEIGDSAIN